jgi:glutamate synthase domain-containing protein 2
LQQWPRHDAGVGLCPLPDLQQQRCPSGIATQNPRLYRGLVVADKARRVARFHAKMDHATADLISSAGLRHTS